MKTNNKSKEIHCPYCGKKAFLKPGTFVYGDKSPDVNLYVCGGFPACDSFVGVHKNTIIPMGTIADRNLRKQRKETHLYFDLLWKKGVFSRSQAYKWLQDKFGMTDQQAHIGNFSEHMCEMVIKEVKQVLENCNISDVEGIA